MGAVVLAILFAAGRIIISEVMANPAGAAGAHGPEDRNEFVELYNSWRTDIDLSGWVIDDGDSRDELVAWSDSSILAANPGVIIGYTWLMPGGYAVVLDSEYTDPSPTGGCVQPYRLPEGTLVLATGNTTLGNGLAAADPLTLISSSAYGFEDTSTFGTPGDSADSLPGDPGDGVSWERIRLDRPDTVDNWTACLDSGGCTPGAPNSVTAFLDLAVSSFIIGDSAVAGAPMTASLTVANTGFLPASDWSAALFLDRNGNGSADAGEEVVRLTGASLLPDAESSFAAGFVCPNRQTDLWAEVTCPGDRDAVNNRRRVTIDPGGPNRLLSLDLSSFSPNGDGFEDSLVVRFRTPAPGGTMTAIVFDLAGRAVATLANREKVTAERGVFTWDGRGRDSRPAANGVYAVWLEYSVNGVVSREQVPVVLFRK